MAQQPHRPFESLEWYREAARNDFRDDATRSRLQRWARGFGMLHAHISVYVTMIVALLLLNLLRSPDHIWADKWIMAWTVLILLHAVGVGILWAIGQWNSDAPDEALQMATPVWQAPPTPAWGNGSTAQDVEFRVSDRVPADQPVAQEGPAWTGWNADTAVDDTPAAERVSWQQASAAAWLQRGNGAQASPNGETSGDAGK